MEGDWLGVNVTLHVVVGLAPAGVHVVAENAPGWSADHTTLSDPSGATGIPSASSETLAVHEATAPAIDWTQVADVSVLRGAPDGGTSRSRPHAAATVDGSAATTPFVTARWIASATWRKSL
jgi:hypothetical protein